MVCHVVVVAPMETVKTRLIESKKGLIDGVKYIVRNHGVSGAIGDFNGRVFMGNLSRVSHGPATWVISNVTIAESEILEQG